jgi:hypothetical protein
VPEGLKHNAWAPYTISCEPQRIGALYPIIYIYSLSSFCERTSPWEYSPRKRRVWPGTQLTTLAPPPRVSTSHDRGTQSWNASMGIVVTVDDNHGVDKIASRVSARG